MGAAASCVKGQKGKKDERKWRGSLLDEEKERKAKARKASKEKQKAKEARQRAAKEAAEAKEKIRQVKAAMVPVKVSGDIWSSDGPRLINEAPQDPKTDLAAGKRDRHALSSLFRALDGAHWHRKDNWNTVNPLSMWVGTLAVRGRVIELKLSNNGLQGEIPNVVAQLSALTTLDLCANSLTGEIPVGLANLRNLRLLDLSYNFLTGRIPGKLFGRNLALTHCYLNRNRLTGTLPAGACAAPNIKVLAVDHNELVGEPQCDLAPDISLGPRELRLNDNQWLDADLARIRMLREIECHGCRLVI